MPDIWFTADFHLDHRNIIRYCRRPFDDVAQMDAQIIDRLNKGVKEKDLLYFLGDFCFRGHKRTIQYLDQVRCKRIFFVKGNHHRTLRKIQDRFLWFGDLAEVSVYGQAIVLCHYAMRVWNGSSRGAWQLFGHAHGKLQQDPAIPAMDVDVDTHDFQPWHSEEIRQQLKSGH